MRDVEPFRQLSFRYFWFCLSLILWGLMILCFPYEVWSKPLYAGLVIDAKTGKTLYAEQADAPRYPASLTKMMTLYLLFQELESGRLRLSSPLKVSRSAAARPPSKLGLSPGGSLRVDEAIQALIIKSANDVAVVVAENIGGSEAEFARLMTRKARQLGMRSTTFRNASGLPNSEQKTTARDMARLGLALQRDFPNYYSFFQRKSFQFRGHTYHTHNHLLNKLKGVDGIKTGYINASGFNVVTSYRNQNRHVIAVVLGGQSGAARDAQARKLIELTIGKSAVSRQARVSSQALPTKTKDEFLDSSLDLNTVPPPPERPFSSRKGIKITPPHPAPVGVASLPPPLPEEMGNRGTSKLGKVQEEKVDPSPDTRGGLWQIQVAAVPSQEGAQRLLTQLRVKAGSLLAPYTASAQKAERDGKTFYRVRFVGFETQISAQTLCRRLKEHNYACFALRS